MEGHFTEESRLHYITAMRRLGHQPRDVVFEAATVVLEHSGRRLAVTEVTPPRGRAKSKIVWWIEGNQLERVVCADTGGEEIPIRHGPCAAEIAATFQISDWQLDGPQ